MSTSANYCACRYVRSLLLVCYGCGVVGSGDPPPRGQLLVPVEQDRIRGLVGSRRRRGGFPGPAGTFDAGHLVIPPPAAHSRTGRRFRTTQEAARFEVAASTIGALRDGRE